MTDEHVLDLLPGYALGSLDEGDLLVVARHLPRCAACRGQLASYLQTTDLLAQVVVQRTPPPDLRAKVLQRVTGAADREQLAERPPRPEPGFSQRSQQPQRPLRWQQWLQRVFSPQVGLALAVIALVLITGLAASSALLWRQVTALQAQSAQEHPLTGPGKLIVLKGTQNAPQATGYLMVFQDNTYGTLTIDDAPMLDANHQYQVWLIQDGKRTSGGVFSVNEEGYGAFVIDASQPLAEYDSFGVTIEPAGGSPGPTGQKVLGGP